jgi:methylglyoxal synthase
MHVGLIAHDSKKPDLVQFVRRHRDAFVGHQIFATGHTGREVMDAANLPVECFLSGPQGGDQQMGAQIAQGAIDLLIFIRDPLFAHPHEPDVAALLRVSDVHGIPVATNLRTAECLLDLLREGGRVQE